MKCHACFVALIWPGLILAIFTMLLHFDPLASWCSDHNHKIILWNRNLCRSRHGKHHSHGSKVRDVLFERSKAKRQKRIQEHHDKRLREMNEKLEATTSGYESETTVDLRTTSIEKEAYIKMHEGHCSQCKMPFKFPGLGFVEFQDCAYEYFSQRTWCPTELDEGGFGLWDKWIYCPKYSCDPTRGPAGQSCDTCQFPFTFNNVEYNDCTVDHDTIPWCSNKTDDNGVHIQGNWHYCPQQSCVTD